MPQISSRNLPALTPLPSLKVSGRAVRVFAAAAVVALAAHISFPLPFTPVPFTLQPMAVLGVGLWLGSWDGAYALMLYLLEGAASLPVFAPTGSGGLAHLLGPTGGYLLAYPIVAWLAGDLTSRLRSRASAFPAALTACTVATFVLFLSGASWLVWQGHLPWSKVWFVAVLPFLPGETVKIFAAAGTYRALTGQQHILHTEDATEQD